jgi:hypothetical protein
MNTNTNIKEIGAKLCEFVDKQDIHLSGDQDGRIESLHSEESITSSLKKNFPNEVILHPDDNRSFGDFTIKLADGTEHPVNIKMIKHTSTYNSANVKHLSYCLYGANTPSYNSFATKIRQDEGGPVNEYWYMIFYKGSSRSTAFFCLSEVATECAILNPSNGVQFKPIMRLVERTPDKKRQFIIDLFKKLAKKRAMAWLILEADEGDDA